VLKFTKGLQDADVISGSNSEFVCEVSPAEAPTRWLVNNQEVFEGEKYKLDIQGNSRKLTIRNCTEEDRGNVKVTVGEEESSARLSVIGNFK
jgi:hypothetical protein